MNASANFHIRDNSYPFLSFTELKKTDSVALNIAENVNGVSQISIFFEGQHAKRLEKAIAEFNRIMGE